METHQLPEDLNLLLALEVLLRERHVTRAARRLGLTQSAMSQRLGRLRAFFDDPLLVAGRPSLALTPRAEAMAEPLARALGALRSAVQAGRRFEPLTSERAFVLLGNDMLEAQALPVLGPALRQQAPRVQVQIERIDAGFAARLGDGTADLAFVPDFLVSSAMRRMPLPPERFVVLARRGHPALRGALTLDRYLEADHVLIAPRGAPGSVVDRALDALGCQRRVAFRVPHFVTAPLLLPGTDLLLTCTASVASHACSMLELDQAEPPLDLPLDHACMVWHERSQNDPGHGWLRGLFERQVSAAR